MRTYFKVWNNESAIQEIELNGHLSVMEASLLKDEKENREKKR